MTTHQQLSDLTPQQRWQRFRDERLPQLSRRQRWLLISATSISIVLFVVLALPFLLPLGGPEAVPVSQLSDRNGVFVTLKDVDLYYQHASASGEAVILIHGQAGSTLTWQDTLSALSAAGYDTYVLDLPGYGLSEKGLQLDFSHPHAADLVYAFMDAQNIAQAHLVGHAYGANIAAYVAQAHPQRVASLTLVAPTLITWEPPQVPESVLNLFFVERWIRVGVRLVSPAAVGEQLRSATKVDDVVDSQLIDDYARLMQTEDWAFTAIGVIRDSHLNQLPAPLETIMQPTLLIWGTEDGWAPPDAADGILNEINDAQLQQIPGVGHLPMHESVQEFNTILINFLDNE
jgi:pyruvate dehydrogenase E2 component (dihydrolipoamide acetyltransferase)